MHLQCTCNALAFNKSCESMIYGFFCSGSIQSNKTYKPTWNEHTSKDVAKIWKIKI
nr:MAG TPA: hypothetical protein [Caudoviricetes sp.]